MKLELSPKQLKAKIEFGEYAKKEIGPYAEHNDRKGKIPRELIFSLGEKGYLTPMLPKSYWGLDMDMLTVGLLNEEIGKYCTSIRAILTVQGMVALAIQKWGTEGQRTKWLPLLSAGRAIASFGLTEPDTGTDAKSIGTTAELVDNHFILNGTKKWITAGQIADVFLIIAQCEGKPTAFLVEKDTPGLHIKALDMPLGARASMLAEVNMQSCKIPNENIVGKIGSGLSHIALYSLDFGRYTVAWGCVGLGQACLEQSIKYSKYRKQFNVPLRKHQLIQKMITEMVVNVKAARMLCYSAGYLKDICDPDSIIETWTAKYFASTMLNKIATNAVQIHGANGCSKEYPVERYMRDAKIYEIIEGTTQIHEVIIASNAYRANY